ncbi:MAG: asparagine synthase C-terminal domain-containing protein, partial [Myxococcota bacterium]|nr:asparagine synthase C-terminal domain-containing protein [Myxococcota bacterium]
PWVSRDLATDHIAELLSYRYVNAPRTLYRDVQAVPPGHIVRIDAHGERTERWWRPRWSPPGAPPPKDEALVQQVDAALGRAVHRRAREDEDVAVLLSGGLDSSAILWHLTQCARVVPTYTIALADDLVDESSFAGRVAKVMGAEHRVVRVTNDDLVDNIHACTRMMGHPLPGAAAVLQHLLFKAIRPDARVVLSGDGGDEVLAGRGMEQVAQRLRGARLLGTATGPLSGTVKGLAGRLGLRDLAASSVHFGRDRNIGGSRVFHSAERVEILRDPGMVRPGIRRLVLDPLYQEVDSDPVNAILHVWQRGWLPEDSLFRSDRMAAHAGVEVRYPMLDRDFMGLAAGLPGPVKVHPVRLGWVTKWPLRQAMLDRMPDRAYVRRPKRSMPNPLDRWLRDQGRAFLRDAVEGLLADPTALFAPSAVRRLMAEHLESKANHGLKLWTLTLFHAWRTGMGA